MGVVSVRTRRSKPRKQFYGPFGYAVYTHIYALQAAPGFLLSDSPIKIGQARNVRSRLSSCQTGSPVKLLLLGSLYLPESVEKGIHDQLSDDWSHGEWFLPTERVRRIASYLQAKDAKAIFLELHLYQYLTMQERDQVNFDDAMAWEGRLASDWTMPYRTNCKPPKF